jgi:hypothetical protein
MQSKTIICNRIEELHTEIKTHINNNFQPSLAIVFTSIQHDLKTISQTFSSLQIDLIGCTTAGEIANDELLEGALVCMLLDIKKQHYQMFFSEFSAETVYQAGFATGAFASQSYKNPALLVMSSGLGLDAAKLVSGIKNGVGKNIPIYGGLAGDELQMKSTFALSNNQISASGMAALIIDTDQIMVEGLAISGCKPIGGINTITSSKDNIVYTINGKRASDVFKQYFGLEGKPLTLEQTISLQTNYPIQLLREEGHLILRSLFFLNEEEGTITLSAGVNDGDKFQFSNSPGFEVIEKTIDEFSHFKNHHPSADAVILYSCKGRHGAFGPSLEEEVAGLYEHWNTPLIGFLSYGEIGNTANGTCEFHNATCSMVLLKEKQ